MSTSLRAKVADGRKTQTLTREAVVEALQLYGELYGPDFPQSAFAPSQAKRNGRPELVDLYYKGRPDGRRWPSLNAIKDKFGTWNAARGAAGFPPNSTGPASGRRKPGEAEPILNIRERLVYVSDDRAVAAMHRAKLAEEKLGRALERARIAEAKLKDRPVQTAPKIVTRTQTKTVTKVVKVTDDEELRAVRIRLADTEAALRAVKDQLKAENLEHGRMVDQIAQARSEATQSRSEAKEAVTAMLAAESRQRAAERLTERLRRDLAEQGRAITGEKRRLTRAELTRLRTEGPAGPAVLAKALDSLAKARRRDSKEQLERALLEVASAAVAWHGRL